MHTATAALALIARADSATWGQALEASARAAAALLVAAYAAGLVLGAWVHRLSGALGAIASRPHRPVPKAARPAPAAAERHQAACAALDGLTVPQLRQLARKAGHRALARSGRRVDLLQALAA
jgi:hypothetical protein